MHTSKLLMSGMAAPAPLPFVQVDAFSRDPFGGNPAAIVFDTLSGALTARPAADGAITIDLPARPVTPATLPADVLAALGVEPTAVYVARKGPGGTDFIVECADPVTGSSSIPNAGTK